MTNNNILSSKKLVIKILLIILLIIIIIGLYDKNYNVNHIDSDIAESTISLTNKDFPQEEINRTDSSQSLEKFSADDQIQLLHKLLQYQESLKQGKTLTLLYYESNQDIHLNQIITEINSLISLEKNYTYFYDNLKILKRELERNITQEKLITAGISNNIAFNIAKLFNYRNLKKNQANLNNLEESLIKLESAISYSQFDIALSILNYLPETDNIQNYKIHVKNYLQLSLLFEYAIKYIINTRVQK